MYLHVALRCVALRCAATRYATLRYVTLRYVTLHYITLHYITLHYITLHCMTWHCMTWHDMTWHDRWTQIWRTDLWLMSRLACNIGLGSRVPRKKTDPNGNEGPKTNHPIELIIPSLGHISYLLPVLSWRQGKKDCGNKTQRFSFIT